VLHALQSGSGKHLTRWAASQPPPPPGCTYLNFTASHDGVGVRPLEGLLATKQIQELGDLMKVIGGHVSEKSNPDGTRSPYEINITYFDAMSRSGDEDPSRKVNRFLCSQLIALGLRGVPAVYFNSLVAGPNDHQGVKNLGYPRAINRHKWDESHLTSLLNDPRSPSSQVFDEYRRVIRIRSQQPAFHPDADQVVHNLGDELFAFSRVSSTQTVLCVSNLSGSAVTADLARTGEPLAGRPWRDLLSGDHTVVPGPATLDAYQTRWIVADHA